MSDDIGELIGEIEGAEWWERGDVDSQTTFSTAPERLAQAYAALEARCAELEKERDSARTDCEILAKWSEEDQVEIATLRKALEFYADTSKYPAPLTGGMGELWADCGGVARVALGEGR